MMEIETAKATLGEEFAFFCDLIREQLEVLELPAEARILDVGTGMGRAAITLALCGHQVLTGEPAGPFTQSYHALTPLVAYSAWNRPNRNHEPMTRPDTFGARASKLIELLDRGHYDVELAAEDWERLVTWIDANALFYGTFNPEGQAKQLRGERIDGPDLE